MSEVKMVVVDRVRYRPEDAPEKAAAPAQEVTLVASKARAPRNKSA